MGQVTIGEFKGVVLRYDVAKGFGFARITHNLVDSAYEDHENSKCHYEDVNGDYDDVFLHFREVTSHSNGKGVVKLNVSEIVEFVLVRTDKGNSAENIKVIGSELDEYMDKNYNTEEYNGSSV